MQSSEQPCGLRRRSVEQTGGLGQIGLHCAGQLGQQHLARLQVGDGLDLGDGYRATVHVAALDDERLVVLGELLDRLGGIDSLALDERDRGRADEQLVETLDARFRRGTLHQRVLGDRIGSGVTERSAQVFEVGHRQPAVLGDERRRRVLELLGDVGNRGGLFSLGHACLLVVGDRGRMSKGPEMTNAPTQTVGARCYTTASSSCVGRPVSDEPLARRTTGTSGPSTDFSVTDGLRWNVDKNSVRPPISQNGAVSACSVALSDTRHAEITRAAAPTSPASPPSSAGSTRRSRRKSSRA